MKRRADEDALREREDAEMEDLVPPTPPIPRAVRQVHSSQLSHTRDDTRDVGFLFRFVQFSAMQADYFCVTVYL